MTRPMYGLSLNQSHHIYYHMYINFTVSDLLEP